MLWQQDRSYQVRIIGAVPFFGDNVTVMRLQWRMDNGATGWCNAFDLNDPPDVVDKLANIGAGPVVAMPSIAQTGSKFSLRKDRQDGVEPPS